MVFQSSESVFVANKIRCNNEYKINLKFNYATVCFYIFVPGDDPPFFFLALFQNTELNLSVKCWRLFVLKIIRFLMLLIRFAREVYDVLCRLEARLRGCGCYEERRNGESWLDVTLLMASASWRRAVWVFWNTLCIYEQHYVALKVSGINCDVGS